MNRFALVTLIAFGAARLSFAQAGGETLVAPDYQLTSLASHYAYPLETVTPRFPIDQRMRGEEGYALVEVVVGEDGRTEGLTLLSASAPEFGASAVKAVSQWLFEPGRRKGEAIRQTVVIPIDFRLEGLPRRARQVASL